MNRKLRLPDPVIMRFGILYSTTVVARERPALQARKEAPMSRYVCCVVHLTILLVKNRGVDATLT